jgi:hypothetical protein
MKSEGKIGWLAHIVDVRVWLNDDDLDGGWDDNLF